MKTIAQINRKIASGKVVVVTAEEMIDIVKNDGIKKAAARVDVVTTGTFAPMCSSGVFLNVGHTIPRMKMEKVYLNGIETHAGLAAVDLYLGASQLPDTDPRNAVFPGAFSYGGGHVIEDLLAGKKIHLSATAYGTDCYPAKEFAKTFRLKDIKNATLVNPRNCYQNYACAINLHSPRTIYTYMGTLLPGAGNATYSSAGQLSPLLKDPYLRTIGTGTRIFLGGGTGYIMGAGTQHNPDPERLPNGTPTGGAATLAVHGDFKQMNASWIRGASIQGYGASLAVSLGVPIPILDEKIAKTAALADDELLVDIIDYSKDYPAGKAKSLGRVSYAALKSGSISFKNRTIPTSSMSSYAKAREIADLLKSWIEKKRFFLTEPLESLADSSGTTSGKKS